MMIPVSRHLTRLVPLVLTLFLVAPAAFSQESDQAARDQQFEETMKDARLEGNFSVVSDQGMKSDFSELYMVSELERGADNTWIFKARMKYGENAHEAEFPIPVQVVWAGDTPVITMENTTVEGLGTFTVRLLLHGDRYAGTWQHGAFGGHMWGRIMKGSE
jgi:hypothetical protein